MGSYRKRDGSGGRWDIFKTSPFCHLQNSSPTTLSKLVSSNQCLLNTHNAPGIQGNAPGFLMEGPQPPHLQNDGGGYTEFLRSL